jgi:hypothetical protein
MSPSHEDACEVYSQAQLESEFDPLPVLCRANRTCDVTFADGVVVSVFRRSSQFLNNTAAVFTIK